MVVMELGRRIMNLLNYGKCGGGSWVLCPSFPIAVDNNCYTAGLVKFPMAVEKRSGGGTHGKE